MFQLVSKRRDKINVTGTNYVEMSLVLLPLLRLTFVSYKTNMSITLFSDTTGQNDFI